MAMMMWRWRRGRADPARGRIDRQTGWCPASMRHILSLSICFALIRFTNNSNQRDLVIEGELPVQRSTQQALGDKFKLWGAGERERERWKGCLPASLANGPSDALRVARWLRRRGAGESGDDYPADQVDGAVVEAEEAHAETQALQRTGGYG